MKIADNINTVGRLRMLVAVLQKAEEVGMSIDEYAEAGYNENSGYVYIWDECYMFSVGIADYAYHRGEEVELILSCPETGEEFFDTTENGLYEQYREYCETEEIECYI